MVLEPDDQLNLSITSPAATVALALMYLRTNDPRVAGRFALPDTPYGLDGVRPDLVTLRALGAALVMWDGVEPSGRWIAASMPPLFRVGAGARREGAKSSCGPFSVHRDVMHVHGHSVSPAHCCVPHTRACCARVQLPYLT